MNMEIENGSVGRAIKAARNYKGMTQEELSEEIGIVPMHLKNIESGRRTPSLGVLIRLAQAVNLSIDSIIYPEKSEGQELRGMIERRLKECTTHELKVIASLIDAMHNKEPDE